jgi:hypothetical protein
VKKEAPISPIYAVLASVSIATVLVVLRFISSGATIYLDSVQVSNFEFTRIRSQSALFNETATADMITLTGFTATIGQKMIQEIAVSLQRSDQLHIKELFVEDGTKIRVAIDGAMLGIIAGDRVSVSCCEGRIGIGERVLLTIPPSEPSIVDSEEPNPRIQCTSPPCTLVLRLQNKPIENLIQDQVINRVSFKRAGTETSVTDGRIDSSILKGKIVISGIDLLGTPFVLRTVELSPGDVIDVEPDGSILANVDLQDGSLLVTGALKNASKVLYSSRGGDTGNLVPSALEIILREPWHQTIWGIAVALLPIGLQVTRRVLKTNGLTKRRYR